MSKSKFQKKKERERDKKHKILKKREAKCAVEKEKRNMDKLAEFVSPSRKQKPITNVEFYREKELRELGERLNPVSETLEDKLGQVGG